MALSEPPVERVAVFSKVWQVPAVPTFLQGYETLQRYGSTEALGVSCPAAT